MLLHCPEFLPYRGNGAKSRREAFREGATPRHFPFFDTHRGNTPPAVCLWSGIVGLKGWQSEGKLGDILQRCETFVELVGVDVSRRIRGVDCLFLELREREATTGVGIRD